MKTDTIRNALLVTGNISQISLLARKNMWDTAKMKPLTPVSYMLADVMYSPREIANYFGSDLIGEYKYDGIRAQVHINGNEVRIFSRNLNDITLFFPELVQWMPDNVGSDSIIFDGEILAYKDKKNTTISISAETATRQAVISGQYRIGSCNLHYFRYTLS